MVPPPPAEHADVAGVAFLQHVDHVLEVLDVSALVAGQGDAVGVFLQGGADHVLDAAVVAQVHHFRALGLDQAAHDVDGRIVAVEQAGRGDESQGRCFRARLAGWDRLGNRVHDGFQLLAGCWILTRNPCATAVQPPRCPSLPSFDLRQR
jgi:hypothetical protein